MTAAPVLPIKSRSRTGPISVYQYRQRAWLRPTRGVDFLAAQEKGAAVERPPLMEKSDQLESQRGLDLNEPR
jgi:hypothetical protein